MQSIFFEITVIICLAAVLSIIFRFLKQPSILAYIFTGIIIGPLGLFHLGNKEALETLGQLGITLLLFMLGLELKLKELKSIGKTAIIAGTLQMWFTFFCGFFLAFLLGVEKLASIYIGIAASFSSTIIIVKILSDKKDLNSLHGKIAIGILLMQDLFAILTIIFLSEAQSFATSSFFGTLSILLIKVVVLFSIIIFLSNWVFPKLTSIIAKSPESLFLFSLAWVFALTAFVTAKPIGFSIEIGGFLAGLALANTHENFQIIAKMKALRDFFITIFFVMLGLQMTFGDIVQVLKPAIVLSLFVLVVKPFIIMAITGLLGYRKRTSFLVGASMGQVSEFSLVIMFLGNRLGVVSDEIVTLIILVSLITFAFSTYVLQHANFLYKLIGKYFDFIEEKRGKGIAIEIKDELADLKNHIIVVGGEHMGQSIIHALEGEEQILVVDFNPDVVKKLEKAGIKSFFGDIADVEIQERAKFDKAKLVISTVSDLEDNLVLIEGLRHANKKAKIVVMALQSDDAKALYKAGADYVVLPHLAGGRHLAKILKDNDDLKSLEHYKTKDLAYLN